VEIVTDMADEKTDRYTQLSSQIQEKFLANQQTQKIYDQKDAWRVEMELIIQELYPNCRLVLCGSSANGFGSIDSDIDLVLSVGEGGASAGPYMLRRIESLFTRKPRRFETKVVSDARVPIIKLKDKEKSFETDISVENWANVRNAFLLKCYSECDPRVKPLVITIKLWAQKAEITDAKLHRLSGFALVLLVIHYLQAGCSPAVLPALQKNFPELFRSPKTTVVTELTNDLPPQVQSYKSNNTQSLGELLMGFFKYYTTFGWDRTISVRMGGTQPTRRGRIWSGPYIRLADPTDEGNVTRAVYSLNEFTRIKNAFKSASDQLSQSESLHNVL